MKAENSITDIQDTIKETIGEGQKIWRIQTTITQISAITKNHLIHDKSLLVFAQYIQAATVKQAVAVKAFIIIISHQTATPNAIRGAIQIQSM